MSVNVARSRVANAVKKSRARGLDPRNDPSVMVARGDLAVDKVEAYVTRAVAEAPPLNEAQKARLTALFREVTRA